MIHLLSDNEDIEQENALSELQYNEESNIDVTNQENNSK